MENPIKEKVRQAYLDSLTPEEFKSRKTENLLVRQAIRNWAKKENGMTLEAITELEQEVYGGKSHHSTIINSLAQHDTYMTHPLYKMMYRALLDRNQK